ncbi:MAG: 4'-phosphopantetheinyl transferase [Candidatus Magnetoglobus multicellularis str. Araruama]|uniref:4'-phosphopantetheinyl transferase n=1 Tax=Candidatus Magnetoglobus multicellularis str. Araruama TaxID=890399 RepID=A0A1V1PBI4_9BACT|nr:MAG: 4'-phosphopantetheinyl transferase [Candidatus Magnetoglobus multicellularis str. Araruama]
MKLNILYPVILTVPAKIVDLTMPKRVKGISQLSRETVFISAYLNNLQIRHLKQAPTGMPEPDNDVYWSVSHKPKYVCGVASNRKIGIDIEEIRPQQKSMYAYVASDDEWRIIDDAPSKRAFFRCWTAKEAVLKAVGTGISDLLKCRVIEDLGEPGLLLDYHDRLWRIEHFYLNHHIAAIIHDDDIDIQWQVI